MSRPSPPLHRGHQPCLPWAFCLECILAKRINKQFGRAFLLSSTRIGIGVSASRWGRAIDEVQTVSCASQPWLEFLDFIPFGYSINQFPIASPHQRTVHKDETSQSRPSQASACTLEKTSFPNFNSHLLGGLYVSRPCVSLSKDPKRKSRALGQQTRDFITH